MRDKKPWIVIILIIGIMAFPFFTRNSILHHFQALSKIPKPYFYSTDL